MTAKTSAKTTRVRAKSRAATTATVPHEILIPEEYEPIGMWGYFGYLFLFQIPVIGWIICISLAFAARNYNLRNFARSQFCVIILWVLMICILALCGVLGEFLHTLMPNLW